MKDFKYLAAFSIPLMAFVGVYFKGIFTYLVPVYAFIFLPILEMSFPIDASNLDAESVASKLKNNIFDWLLYLNLPIIFTLLFISLKTVASQKLETYEFIGLLVSLGIVLAINGINVAHELGHRQTTNERFLGKALLLPSLYMHFYIEHNFGHHLHVATPEDPATARYNQTVYSFWFTSTIRQYFKSWKIQKKLLKNNNKSFFSIKNDMFWYTIFQISYLVLVYLFFSNTGLIFAIAAATVSFIMLETVNYIEHYGLLRLKTKSGRYERLQKIHSWNSNHIIGRIVLYELTRHSDHHYKTTKKYQILDCHKESPQMPYGYPTSMLISLFPPLWFKIMNKRIPKEMLTTL